MSQSCQRLPPGKPRGSSCGSSEPVSSSARFALLDRVLSYVDEHYTMTLATHGSEGPWAASVYYARDAWELFFLSDPRSRHSRNIACDPAVAAAIDEDYRDWREIKGVQLEGLAHRLEKGEKTRAMAAYLGKFPFARDLLESPERHGFAVAAKLLAATIYVLRPRRVFFLDNSRGFGFRESLDVDNLQTPGN